MPGRCVTAGKPTRRWSCGITRLNPAKDIVDDGRERSVRVDRDTTLRDFFPCPVQAFDQFALRFPSSPFVLRAPGKPPVQRVEVHFENENAIKEVDEFGQIS
jgi:hypothetical protein